MFLKFIVFYIITFVINLFLVNEALKANGNELLGKYSMKTLRKTTIIILVLSPIVITFILFSTVFSYIIKFIKKCFR